MARLQGIVTELSPEACALICGLVAPSEHVNTDGICVSREAWAEVRSTFPFSSFVRAVDDGTIPEYHEEF